MAEYTLGIDMGTSGVKVGVLDLSVFRLIALAMKGYDNSTRTTLDNTLGSRRQPP